MASIAILVFSSSLFAAPTNEDVNRHTPDQARLDSLAAALPFVEDKVQAALEGADTDPISFFGEAQMRGQWHNYSGLADTSYLLLSKSGIMLGGDEPVFKLGMVIRPSRNTTLWGRLGVSASYQGYNNPNYLYGTVPGDSSAHYAPGKHASNKQINVFEDMAAGMAIRTKVASFQLKMGAMNWTEASPLSIWKAQARLFAWEKMPYEIEQPIKMYYTDNIVHARREGRAAWNKKGFQGVEFSVENAPAGLGGFFMFGSGMPFNKLSRSHLDMATDAGLAADVGSIVEAGTGDNYTKHLFYRLTKKVGKSLTLGFNNGYIIKNDDVTAAGFVYENLWNTKFDVGRYNSIWLDTTTGVYDTVVDATTYAKVLNDSAHNITTSLGEGFYVEPKNFSLDIRGTINSRWSILGDVGLSYMDTTFHRMGSRSLDPSLNDSLNQIDRNVFEVYADVEPYDGIGTQVKALDKQSTRTTRSDFGFSAFTNVGFKTDPVTLGLDLFIATKEFHAPYSFVNYGDVYWAQGSNLLGEGAFLNSNEASPYGNNMMAFELTAEVKVPWYGHLRFKYGLNRQLEEGKDVIFLNYRLNGSQFTSTLNSWYSKWGLGTITESYDFQFNQGVGPDPDGNPSKDTIARAPLYRVADQSYTGANAPTKGGLRADGHGLFEGFVPYGNPADVIFNWFSGSTVVGDKRDLASIWSQKDQNFIDMTDGTHIRNIMIVDESDTSYYTLNGTTMTIADDTLGTNARTESVTTVSETGFVPVTTKRSFRFVGDWALDLSKYISYDNDLLLSLYYEINGVTKSVKPLAFSSEDEDVLLISHYLRTEPAIAITDKFYVIGLFGWERWMSGKTWAPIAGNDGIATGFKKSALKTDDIAWGLGFDWDILKRVSLHARYTWYSHTDEQLSFNNYKGQAVAFELKAFF